MSWLRSYREGPIVLPPISRFESMGTRWVHKTSENDSPRPSPANGRRPATLGNPVPTNVCRRRPAAFGRHSHGGVTVRSRYRDSAGRTLLALEFTPGFTSCPAKVCFIAPRGDAVSCVACRMRTREAGLIAFSRTLTGRASAAMTGADRPIPVTGSASKGIMPAAIRHWVVARRRTASLTWRRARCKRRGVSSEATRVIAKLIA